jgi:biotin operon repressor
MITWKFELDRQKEYYNAFKKQLERDVWQNLKYYVLHTMPEKFRGRVIFLPKVCEPKKIYIKQKFRLNKLEIEWNKIQSEFENKLKKYFPEIEIINVVVSPSFYGSVGWYGFWDNGKTILIRPRYDRRIIDIQKLVINALTHYFFISKSNNLEKTEWLKKQKLAEKMQIKILGVRKESKTMHGILETEFSGNLASKSIGYLKELGLLKPQKVEVVDKLTKTENKIFDLLVKQKGNLVSFDEIAKTIWGEDYFDKYSEYAITKHIENLKNKITENSIHSQRGHGYLLM